MSAIVVIVDAYLTGAHIAVEATRRGYKCISIQSSKNLPDFMLRTYRSENFVKSIIFNGDLDYILTTLKEYNVLMVLPGAETGVSLSEQIQYKLGIPGNNPESTHLRRHKYYMIDALRRAGLHAANQVLVSDISSIEKWLSRTSKVQWPLVIKPVNSAGTDGVTFCENKTRLIETANKLFKSKNALGYDNNELVIQSLLLGTEYVVNTISWSGHHKVSDMWAYKKRKVDGAGSIYDMQELIEPNGELQQQLKQYIFTALGVLGVQYGPAHCEVMMTAEGPALVEIGARIQGSLNPSLLNECTGSNHLIKTMDLMLGKANYFNEYDESYSLLKNAYWIEMIAEKEGTTVGIDEFKREIEELVSFHSLQFRTKNGQRYCRTVDLLTSPGVVFLAHSDKKVLEQDYRKYREIERRYFG